MPAFEYSEDEWREAAAHYPLKDLRAEEFALLHRHWMLANQVREAFDGALMSSHQAMPEGPQMLARREFGFMFLWYALLWAVLEALIDPKERRTVELRGQLGRDVAAMTDTLRRFRNAVFHVPRDNDYVDQRLTDLVSQPGSAHVLRRISTGLGRMFLEELARRGIHASSR
jgi:hypothetical protein